MYEIESDGVRVCVCERERGGRKGKRNFSQGVKRAKNSTNKKNIWQCGIMHEIKT